MSKEAQRLESYRRTVAVVVSVVVILLSFLIVRPFLVAILSAAALAYIFYPLYLNILRYLPKKIRAKELGSVLTCLFIVTLVLIPTIFITVVLTAEMKSGYLFLQNFLTDQQPLNNLPPALSQWSAYLPQFKEVATDLAGQLIGVVQGVLKSVPGVILNIFITVFSMYYFLKHGKDLYKFFSELVPLPEGRYKQILLRFDDLSRGMIMGQIVVGLVQGTLAWLGFWALGVPNPVLLGFLTAIISIIPLLGAAVVWMPVALYLVFVGMMSGAYWPAIALFIYGTFVISLIDNFLKPKIVGDRAKIHPLVILFGILGGIQLFGIPGILIGPLILTIFDVVIEIYKETL
ncbi:MAG: AI-2E family transporter [Candidatus Margulisiibacteriota bacterium]